jgi:preprotein translocase subunit SecD
MRTSPWLVITYAVIIFLGILIALPNVLPQSTLQRLPSWLPHNQVSLGLDLRGGSHLVLEVDEADLTRERLQSLLQDARRVLREKNIQTKSIVRNQNQIVVTLNDPAQSDEAVTQLKTLGNTIATGISAGQSDLSVTTSGSNIIVAFSPPVSPATSIRRFSRALKSFASASTRSASPNRRSSASAETAFSCSCRARRIRPAFASFSARPRRCPSTCSHRATLRRPASRC